MVKGSGVELGVRTLSTVAREGFTEHRLEGVCWAAVWRREL